MKNVPDSVVIELCVFDGQLIKTIIKDTLINGQFLLCDTIPEMEEITKMYKDKLAVISISSDGKEDWKKIIADKNMTCKYQIYCSL